MSARAASLLAAFLLGTMTIPATAHEAAGSHKVITLRADEWCPYNCDPDSDRPGILIEVARRVFEAEGYRVDYDLVPWTRALRMTRVGEYDAAVGATVSEAPDFVFTDQPILVSDCYFYVRADDDWQFTGYQDLPNVVLGVIRDYDYGEGMDAYIALQESRKGPVYVAQGEEPLASLARLLTQGRLRALLEDTWVMNHFMAENPELGKRIRASSHLDESGPDIDEIYIAFSPAKASSAIYAKMLSEGLRRLKASGEFREITARYGVDAD